MKWFLKLILVLWGVSQICYSCKKSDFLAAKPNQALIIPSTLKDFDAILENVIYLNGSGVGLVPSLAEAGGDNYYIVPSMFSSDLSGPVYKYTYTWNDIIFKEVNMQPVDWEFAYRCVYYANTVLEGLAKIDSSTVEKSTYSRLKASALFYRAHAFYWAAQIFAPHYDNNSANIDLGIPLKMKADINEPIIRATVQQTYDKIIGDLNDALIGLPDVPAFMTRPSKLAVYGMLCRIYLNTKDYDKALAAANSYLTIKYDLLDFNSITGSSNFLMPMPNTNSEIVFYSILTQGPGKDLLSPYPSRVDTILFASYDQHDLRKKLFFKDASLDFGIPDDFGHYFRGSYDRSSNFFAGIATDEIYLIRAECNARIGNIEAALLDLNTLLRKRWDNTIAYSDIIVTSAEEALSVILSERRKELAFRGLRWTDLRRLNSDGANIEVKRYVDSQMYTLMPNSLFYTYLIPSDVISFNPGMQQNPR